MTASELATPLIVVGVDGSPESLKAVDWAVGHAKATGGTVELVMCWAHPVSYGLPLNVKGLDLEARAREVLEKATADIDLPHERLHTTVVNAAAPTELVRRSEDADLIVVGPRGHGGFAELLLGSVSAYCVHHAQCPVVVVR
jgi:nucleotide-binding universal stress UspA family protein